MELVRIPWWRLKNARIRLVVIFLVVVGVDKVDVRVLGDGSGCPLHYYP